MTPVADSAAEPAESVVVLLSSGTAYWVGSLGLAVVTITDQWRPVVSLSATQANAAEEGPDGEPVQGAVTVRRDGSTLLPLTVAWTVGGSATAGGDYAALWHSWQSE